MSQNPTPQVVVHNQYPVSLVIADNQHNTLQLAPLERTTPISEAKLATFNLKALKQKNYIRVWGRQDAELPDSVATIASVIGTALFFGAMAVNDTKPAWLLWYVLGAAIAVAIAIGIFALKVTQRLDVARRAFAQVASLFLIVGIGVGVPVYALWLMDVDFRSAAHSVILGRGLQLIFISTASLLPALLYFLFDRQQLGTLRDRFEHQIFRLDPYVQTLVDVRSKYGRQIAEVFGSEAVGEARLLRGTRWPILMATLAITIGWITALLPQTFSLTGEDALSGLFAPRRDVVTFGFLGAYFYAVNNTLRRYARGDLKPKAYSGITVRIFVVFIVSWVVGVMFGGKPTVAMVIAFFSGIVPETGLTIVQESLRRQQGKLTSLIPSFQEKHPLTDLEGIDLYDRARLEDEGITNIEGLAHHDLIDLMIETRIPVPRLVDWIDQAILYLHAAPDFRNQLREFGIRTATDLIAAERAGLAGNLTVETRGRVAIVLSTLADDEWLAHVQSWRKPQSPSGDAILLRAPVNGEIGVSFGPVPVAALTA